LVPFQDLTNDGGEVQYTGAIRISDGSPILVPASFVFLPYLYERDEPRRDIQTSSGLAAGRSLGEAVERGLLELIERDAVTRACRGEVPVMAIKSSVVDVDDMQLISVSTLYPAYVVVALINGLEATVSAIGFAARREMSAAVLAAALEAVAAGELTTSPSRQVQTGEGTDPARRYGALNWASLADRSATIEPISADSFHIFERQNLLESVPDACFVDLTTADVASLGVRAARVLAPNMLPFCGY
jgi:ribosomal protein S12 methylthiotransferase accessory factor YcaO